MLSDLTFALARPGADKICVITSRMLYDAPEVQLTKHEILNGVTVHRVWTSRFGRSNHLGRAIDYATFCISAVFRLWRLARRGDVVVAKTDPPMLSVVVAPVVRMHRAKLVNWLHDIFPEVAQELGVGRSTATRLTYDALRVLRNRTLYSAEANVVLGGRMAKQLTAFGVASDRIRIIANWTDGKLIEPRDKWTNALRRERGLSSQFVVGYSGNLGRVHEIETMLAAIERFESLLPVGCDPAQSKSWNSHGIADMEGDTAQGAISIAPSLDPPVRWLFIGGGGLFGKLRGEVERRGLRSVQFRPYQPRERLAESLSVPDVHLVSLRRELEGLIVPSKFYGIAASGRPTIFIGDPAGEIAKLIARHSCGISVSAGDGAGLARVIACLARDPAACQAMGQRARAAFVAEFDKSIAVTKWQTLIHEIASR